LKHFIITRFGFTTDYEHLEERIALFKRFTLPSIKAQTNKNFEWLLLGDPLFVIPGARWFGDQPNKALRPGVMNPSYLRYIRKVTKNEDLVLMTRLDNDDMLMPTYVEDIQKIAKPEQAYDFRGYYLDLNTGAFYTDKIYHKDFTSPFTTLAQTIAKQTIYMGNHAKIGQIYPVTFVEKRNWVQIVHGNNWMMNSKKIAKWGDPAPIHPFVKKIMEEVNAENS